MKSRLKLILIFMLAMLQHTMALRAQENSDRQVYEEAEYNYKIGRIEQAKQLLIENIDLFRDIKESAYRLLALCYLSEDRPEDAEKCTARLLGEFPYFSVSPKDPQRFADMVESIRAGLSTTITTASSQAENLSEVPVPTTLITEEMIRNCGADNLQEVLATYVPGMNIVDCNDDINIAMRGIYSNTQEKILIMLNGHRLNSYCTNGAAPDFSISLEKLKRIEVLRGPASSLYGGVALTAVVNLITKQGVDIDGVEMKAGLGNYGQRRGDLLFGKRFFDLDMLVWGSIYRNKGEERDASERDEVYDIPKNNIKIGLVGDKPTFDFGIQLKWKDMMFLYDSHFSQVVSPFTITTLAASYDHDRYRSFNGINPSFSTKSHHADLSYGRVFGGLNIRGNLTYDHSELTHYQIIYDYPVKGLGTALGFPLSVDSIMSNFGGLGRYINGQEQTIGAQVKGGITYINNGHHKGSIGFGGDYNHFSLEDVRYQIVYNFTMAMPENPRIQEVGKGHEDSFDFYAQLKHQWGPFIFNAGLRYDYKKRYDSSKLDELSPRLALIVVKPMWNLKLSYSKSFVDAPYLYRKSNDFLSLLLEKSVNSDNLKPEIVKSMQLTFAGTEWFKGFNFEVNGFYNHGHDLITTHILEYLNSAENKTVGLELMTSYQRQQFSANLNLTWTHTLKSMLFSDDILRGAFAHAAIDANNNTPAIMSNLVLAWQATKRLKLFTNTKFESKQTTYNMDLVQLFYIDYYAQELANVKDIESADFWNKVLESIDKIVYHEDISARTIFNVGAEYKLGKVTLGVNVHNLFDTKYYRSGMNTRLIPQKGRWMMFNVGYKF